MANKKNIKVRDLKPTKDAKGGGGSHLENAKNPPSHLAGGGSKPVHESGFGGPKGGI